MARRRRVNAITFDQDKSKLPKLLVNYQKWMDYLDLEKLVTHEHLEKSLICPHHTIKFLTFEKVITKT